MLPDVVYTVDILFSSKRNIHKSSLWFDEKSIPNVGSIVYSSWVSDQKNKNPNPLLCNAALSFKNPNSLARSKLECY